MFDTLLIANRGEIACRVAATARRLGIRTVAVYSDADERAAHVAACDAAVHIGGAAARDSYLRAEAVLEAARRTGAQAIHPGYGFLSENEAFATACVEAGIIFVGPPAAAIAAMGSKSAAKALMERAGVPLVPGYHGSEQDADFLRARADEIGYPVLIKASAGGGGKGMRVVPDAASFADALASCRREAAASFGDDQVLIERYLQKPRHIEIQVFADNHGNCVHLFERDCSVQRRHQKVIEEAPAPGMDGKRRRAMGEAAVAAARAVGYVGAGTVEFIVEPDGRFYFMEMNTRLQVEHPVTEMVCGVDLVEWQLRVAAGQPLPLTQEQLGLNGHAIEARIYAENPERGFLPSVGRLHHLRLPAHVAFDLGSERGQPAGVRVDGGVREGDTITPHYDPMIAKLIVWGPDRDAARRRMRQALAQTEIAGVHTNVAFLARLMDDEAFASADLETGLIERQRASLLPEPAPASDLILALALAARLAQRQPAAPWPADPWQMTDNWRNGLASPEVFEFVDEAGNLRQVQFSGTTIRIDDGSVQTFSWRPEAAALSVSLDGTAARGSAVVGSDEVIVFQDARRHRLQLPDPAAAATDAAGAGHLTAPMPGKIIAVHVAVGDEVKAGQALMVMEAMKMEHTICAPAAGRIAAVHFGAGEQVQEGAELVELNTD